MSDNVLDLNFHRTVPIEIMDTTLRDGEQTNNVAFSASEKLHIAQILLSKVCVDRIEIASAKTSEIEQNTVASIVDWARQNSNFYKKIEVLGFVDNGISVDWVHKAGVGVLNLLTKGSLNHLTKQLCKTASEHFKEIETTILYAKSKNIDINVYLEDWSNGFISERNYVYELIDFLSTQSVHRIMLPDTLGILYPTQVYQFISEIKQKYPNQHFDFHPHNDYGLGTANVLEAVRANIDGIHVTMNCLGERTGNASLAQVVAGIHDHFHLKTTVKEEALFSLSRVVETFSGKRLAANEPIVGEDVFTQTAGIHADGDKKGKLYQSKLDASRFGREVSYALGKLSGKASLEQNLKDLGISLSVEERTKILNRIIELGNQKKIISKEDLPFIISDVLNLPTNKKVDIKDVIISTGKRISPICSMVIEYEQEEFKVTGSGSGGYDAFMNGLSIWIKSKNIILPKLINYEVRIPPGGQTSALVECKITWCAKDEQILTTRGVDSDQVMAAIQATEKMLNIVL